MRRSAGLFFICSKTVASVFRWRTERLDRHLAARRGPAASTRNRARLRHHAGGYEQARAGGGVVDDTPSPRGLARPRRGAEFRALLRVEHAGFLAALAFLERLDGRDRGVAELAVEALAVVAGQGQVRLDRHALRQGQGGVGSESGLGRDAVCGAAGAVFCPVAFFDLAFLLPDRAWLAWRRPLTRRGQVRQAPAAQTRAHQERHQPSSRPRVLQ